MITKIDFDNYKSGIKETHVVNARKAGKATNYASVYGSGAETLSRTSGLSIPVAKKLIEGYWKLNWAVKKIAEEQCVIECGDGSRWLVNPVNGFAYSLRSEKDRFSTLCQGTGSYFFDIWCDKILNKMESKWGVKRLTCQCHDDFVQCFTDNEENRLNMLNITEESIKEINTEYSLRRNLGCDVQFGENYAAIHG